MKNIKLSILILILICIFCLAACSTQEQETTTQATTQNTVSQTEIQQDLQQQSNEIIALDLQDNYEIVAYYNFDLIDKVGDNYYAYLNYFGTQTNITILQNCETDTQIQLLYPADFPDINTSLTQQIIMQDTYILQWGSYCTQTQGETIYDQKLTKTNTETGEVIIIDEVEDNAPLAQLVKLDESTFLSYCINSTYMDSEAQYEIITTVTLYNMDGSKEEILIEKYEDCDTFSDSSGFYLQHILVDDGAIYGLGTKKIDGEQCYFKYQYDIDGSLISSEQIIGLDDFTQDSGLSNVCLVGDYLSFRLSTDSSAFICKTGENNIELIASEQDAKLLYAVSGNYICYMQSNVDSGSDEVIQTEDFCFYVIDTQTQMIYEIGFKLPTSEPYFVDLISLSSDEFVLKYCENGVYEPSQIFNFIVDISVNDEMISSISK